MKNMLWCCVGLLVICRAAPASSQVLIGRVVDDATSLPVATALVEVLLRTDSSLVARVTSNADGGFTLTVPSGSYVLTADALGYAAGSIDLDVARGDTLRFELRVSQSAIRLAPLVAEGVRRSRHSLERLNELARRKSAGFGVVMDQQAVRERAPLDLDDLLKDVNGVMKHEGGWLMRGTFGLCSPTLFIDGHRIGDISSFSMPGSTIAALEIYRRKSQMPAEYGLEGCVVSVWTWAYLGDPPAR